MKLAVFFHRFGPYHVARLRSAARKGSLVGMELSGSGGEYAWKHQESDGFERVTVCLEGDSNSLPSRERNTLIQAALNRVQPDLLAIAGYYDRGMLAATHWGLKNGKPMVLMSDSHAESGQRSYIKEWVKRRLVKLFDTAIVAGSRHVDYLQSLGISRERIFDGFDVIDNNYFAKSNPDETPAPRKPTFLIPARFIWEKNLPETIAAYAHYRQLCTQTPWDLVLLGDGPQRVDIEAAITEHRIQKYVHLIGFQNYPDLPGIYRSVSCAILPSINETWGLVVNEAMASSLPVIVSTACGCVPDLVRDGWNGLVFKAGDREKLAQALLRMSSNPEVAATMGQNSGQLIAEWSLERFSHNLWEAARLAKFRRPSPVSRALLRWMIR